MHLEGPNYSKKEPSSLEYHLLSSAYKMRVKDSSISKSKSSNKKLVNSLQELNYRTPDNSPSKIIVIKQKDIEVRQGCPNIKPSLDFLRNRMNSEDILTHIFSKDYAIEQKDTNTKPDNFGSMVNKSSHASSVKIDKEKEDLAYFHSNKSQRNVFSNVRGKLIFQ
jgi:hypothetical protein